MQFSFDSDCKIRIQPHIASSTLMLLCIVVDFFLNNQPDALIIQIYCVIKLYTFRPSSLPIVRSSLHSALISFMQVLMTVSNQSQDGTSWLCLETFIKTCTKLTSAECRELLMMGREDGRNV